MSEEIEVSGMGELRDRVGKLETGMAEIKADLSENSEATKRVESNTGDLVEMMRALSWLGKAAKPLSYVAGIGASLTAAWVAFKSGVK